MQPENYRAFLTPRQNEIMSALEAHGSVRKAAAALKLHPKRISVVKKLAQAQMALHGIAPDSDMTIPIPHPFVAKGHSTLYDRRGKNPQPMLQWVKTKIDDKYREQMIADAIAESCKTIPAASPRPAPGVGAKDKLNLLTVTDSHCGLRAWAEETGNDFDLKIWERSFLESFAYLLKRAPLANKAVICGLGDFFHYDSLLPMTPTSGHVLDADSRYSKMVQAGVRAIRRLVAMTLDTHDSVDIVWMEGNHDPAAAVLMRQILEAEYRNEPRVKVIHNEAPIYAMKFGSNMIGWHHSHLMPMEKLPSVFSQKYREMWGQCPFVFIHTGDKHHERKIDKDGAVVEQHPTLAAEDSYATRHGFHSTRKASLITYKRSGGEDERVTVTLNRASKVIH